MITTRILKIIDFKGISKRKFYQKTGLSNGFLDKVKDIGVSKLEIILSTFNDINPEWLLTGEGSMLRNSNVQKTEQTLVNNEVLEVQDTKCQQQIQVLEQENIFLKEHNNYLRENIDLLKSTIQDKNQIIQLKDKEIAELQKKEMYTPTYQVAEPKAKYEH